MRQLPRLFLTVFYHENKMITFDDFKKVEIRVGEILEAERIEESEKLLKLKVSFGAEDVRQVISGIKKYFDPSDLVGKKAMFVTNLEPRSIMGLESQAMILGIADGESFALLSPHIDVTPGAQAG